jgi:DNA-binding LacI/PurR family transcriptional regulator
MVAGVRRLLELGHRRIVMLAREERRKPGPGLFERVFLEELERQGIETGPYNLPDWEDNPEGLQRCLFSLFQKTPPTALIIEGSMLFGATQQFLLHLGIRVPQEVSIVCTVSDPAFGWSRPTIAHINIDGDIWVRNIMRWVNKVARGKEDRRQLATPANFVEGGTIGPVNAK